ncbi:MAG: AsmA-like C-terminal region-containing protein [Acidobacteriota bacterium]|nr:AsmA-like C-terminal region-containing protein [Acidobacteriota bacterium]
MIVGLSLLAKKWPFTRQAITSALQEGTARTVEIGSFRQTYFPPGCVAENVRFLRHDHPGGPPIITLQKMVVEASYANLLTFTRHVSQVHVTGMHVTVPPRGSGPDGQKQSVMPLTRGKPGQTLSIGKIIADGAVLEFMPGKPDREPYRIEIQKLELSDVGGQGPMDYRSMLAISQPPGEIHSTGKFGPWNPDDPGSTPVSGSYAMDNAKLGVFKGIDGTLSSKGTFQGALDRVDVKGKSDVPDFHVTRSTHTLHISTDFEAVVNGTDGDTTLENVKSSLLRSMVLSSGSVAGKEGQKGKTMALDMSVHEGRIQDLLLLFIKSPQPAISGTVSLHAKVEVPPDARPFLHKLRMEGDFGIGAGKLANVKNQDAINKVSESARGETKKDQEVDPQTVLSDLRGHAVVRNGIANLSHVSFRVAGADAAVSGTYNLLNEEIDLQGTLATNGKLSDATSGFKSVMLKVINPFFKKKEGVKMIPFKITGTYAHPMVALDFGRKK